MADHGWISTSKRAIGSSLQPSTLGSSGGLTELEHGQLGRAKPPHDAELEAALHAAGLHPRSAPLHNVTHQRHRDDASLGQRQPRRRGGGDAGIAQGG